MILISNLGHHTIHARCDSSILQLILCLLQLDLGIPNCTLRLLHDHLLICDHLLLLFIRIVIRIPGLNLSFFRLLIGHLLLVGCLPGRLIEFGFYIRMLLSIRCLPSGSPIRFAKW